MDATRLAKLAAEMMDRLEQEIPDGAEVGVVALVAEVHLRVDEEGYAVEGTEHNATQVTYRCSDDRRWVQTGLLQSVADWAAGRRPNRLG